MPRKLIPVAPGEHVVAGLVFDKRCPRFKGINRPCLGAWRVKLTEVRRVECIPQVQIFKGERVLLIPVARRLRVGDLCNPANLVLEYVRQQQEQKAHG